MENELSSYPSPKPAAEDWGRLHVSRKCIGAGTCRNVSPELLAEIVTAHGPLDDDGSRATGPRLLPDSHDKGAFTGVVRQPSTKEEYLAARNAAAACPFSAIRLEKPAADMPSDELGDPWREWPRRLEDNVWVLGNPSARNAGAMTYFIERRGGGVVVDLPKPSEKLFRWLEDHGGVRWLFLTHRDHVQHHAEFAARFPESLRVMSAADVNRKKGSWAEVTEAVEVQLGNGLGPMTLEGTPIPQEALPDAELAVLPQPGHTPGSLCLLYSGRFLFTGDHLQYSRRLGRIIASRLHCWEDWERQCDSVRQLAAWAEAGRLRFQWLLPGHGEWHRFDGDGSAAVIAKELKSSLEWMRRQPPGNVPRRSWIPFIMSRMNPQGRLGRLVLAIGGEGGEAWVLPRAARQYLSNYDPAQTDAALRRLYALGAAGLVSVSLLIWLATRMLWRLL
jgi:glyoxylase-like metal-dependent hydrolase (beta-lactamase superfamily II)/ferredoxin